MQRDGPPRPSVCQMTGRIRCKDQKTKKKKKKKKKKKSLVSKLSVKNADLNEALFLKN